MTRPLLAAAAILLAAFAYFFLRPKAAAPARSEAGRATSDAPVPSVPEVSPGLGPGPAPAAGQPALKPDDLVGRPARGEVSELMPSGARLRLTAVHPHARPGFPLELRVSAASDAGPVNRYAQLEAIVVYPDNTLEKVGFVLIDAQGTYLATAKNAPASLEPGIVKVSLLVSEEAVKDGDKLRVPTLSLEVPRAQGVWSAGPVRLGPGRARAAVPVSASGVGLLSLTGVLVVDGREVGQVSSGVVAAPAGDGAVEVALPIEVPGGARFAALRDFRLLCQPGAELCDTLPD